MRASVKSMLGLQAMREQEVFRAQERRLTLPPLHRPRPLMTIYCRIETTLPGNENLRSSTQQTRENDYLMARFSLGTHAFKTIESVIILSYFSAARGNATASSQNQGAQNAKS